MVKDIWNIEVGPENDRLPTIGPAPDRLFRRPQDVFLRTVGQAVGPLRWHPVPGPWICRPCLPSEKKRIRHVTITLACHWDPFCRIRCYCFTSPVEFKDFFCRRLTGLQAWL